MLHAAREFLTRACAFAGVPERFVLQHQRKGDEYPSGVAAYISFNRIRVQRDGSQLRHGPPGATTRALYSGQVVMRLELFLRDEHELEQAIEGVLRYIQGNSLVLDGVPMRCPDGAIEVVRDDEDGVLVDFNGAVLEIPVEAQVLESSAWRRLEIELEIEIEGGNPDE
jgi:hypothetical protein